MNTASKYIRLMIGITVLVVAVFYCSITCKANTIELSEIERSSKLIPIINYTPNGFLNHILSKFEFNKYSNAIFLLQKGGQGKFLWYNDFLNSGNYKLDSISPKLTQFQSELINQEDSVFVFNPLPSCKITPNTIKHIGFLRNGNLLLESNDELMDLESFIVSEFGSIDNFSQCYIRDVQSMFYSVECGIYYINDIEEAKDLLKTNFIFNLMSNSPSNKLYDILYVLVSKRLCISNIQSDKLKDVISKAIDNRIVVLNNFLSGSIYELLNSSNLHSVFSEEELKIIKNLIYEEYAKLHSAYSCLNSEIPNIDNKGRYMSDKDTFNVIRECVFSPK